MANRPRSTIPIYLYENGEWKSRETAVRCSNTGVWHYQGQRIVWTFKAGDHVAHEANSVLSASDKEFRLRERDQSTTVFKAPGRPIAQDRSKAASLVPVLEQAQITLLTFGQVGPPLARFQRTAHLLALRRPDVRLFSAEQLLLFRIALLLRSPLLVLALLLVPTLEGSRLGFRRTAPGSLLRSSANEGW